MSRWVYSSLSNDLNIFYSKTVSYIASPWSTKLISLRIWSNIWLEKWILLFWSTRIPSWRFSNISFMLFDMLCSNSFLLISLISSVDCSLSIWMIFLYMYKADTYKQMRNIHCHTPAASNAFPIYRQTLMESNAI